MGESALALRYEDLRLAHMPRGAILWPAATDKCNKEWLVPMSGDVRDAIDRVLQERPGIGGAYLFPSVNNVSKPLAVEVASAWLLEAERIGGVEKHDGTLWHAYRRKWATERKHLPDVDVAAAGGWSDTMTLKQVYQQADMAGMQAVVDEPARLRGASG